MAPYHPRVGDKWNAPPQNAITYNSELALTAIYEIMTTTIKLIPKNIFDLGNKKFKIVYTPNDFNKASTPKMMNTFKENKITPIQHSNVLYQRTILIRQIDKYITATDSNILKDILNELNPFTVTDVNKIPGRDHIIKLVMETMEDVESAKSLGVRFKYTKAAPEHIHTEQTPFRTTICFKCYKINMHTTKQCKYEGSVCSKCAQRGHRHEECKSNFLRCLNCNGPHCCMMKSCPAMKRATRQSTEPHTTNQPPPMDALNYPPLTTQASHEAPPCNIQHAATPQASNQRLITPLMHINTRPTSPDLLLRPVLYQLASDLCPPSKDLPRFATTYNSLLKANQLPAINISAELLEEFTPTPPTTPQRASTPMRVPIKRTYEHKRPVELECSQITNESTYVHQSPVQSNNILASPAPQNSMNAKESTTSRNHSQHAAFNSIESMQNSPQYRTPPSKHQTPHSPTQTNPPSSYSPMHSRAAYNTRSVKKALLPTPKI